MSRQSDTGAPGAKSIRVICVDDDSSTTELHRVVLGHQPDMECVGTRESTIGLVEEIGRAGANVLMPDSDPLSCIAEARTRYPGLVILVVSGMDDPSVVEETLARGADGYYLKTIDLREMIEAIRMAARGEVLDHRNRRGRVGSGR
jgi:DNA-binding NarL/FixJ family response regulator